MSNSLSNPTSIKDLQDEVVCTYTILESRSRNFKNREFIEDNEPEYRKNASVCVVLTPITLPAGVKMA